MTDKNTGTANLFSHFPNAEKNIDLEHAPRPFPFEIPMGMRGIHTGFDMQAHHKTKNGVTKERVIVSPNRHKVEYDRASLKHFVKEGK